MTERTSKQTNKTHLSTALSLCEGDHRQLLVWGCGRAGAGGSRREKIAHIKTPNRRVQPGDNDNDDGDDGDGHCSLECKKIQGG